MFQFGEDLFDGVEVAAPEIAMLLSVYPPIPRLALRLLHWGFRPAA